ncbi:sperm-egg fusion protein TMEM95 [Pantherophis guttatus]|uniref:Sperm-egg fusion protein TMEM95 n=1 Tax=Pantherophis guttatus TaxID=94885 RepID=A0A6P9AVY1_PANGU|nr:sperm-egg fusion protein TMEM95 [Pantherophis guttatus]
MGPPAAPCPGSLFQGGSSPTPAVLLFLILLLFLLAGGATEGCLHCGHQFKNLKMRFAHLCARYRERFGRGGCSKYPWGSKAVRDFALDEAALDLLLEKAHRVLRVMEIKQSLTDLPKFWNWLHEVKIPSETREALCPPACHVVASLFNCSTCRRAEIRCWDMRTCYPEYQGLPKIIQLCLYISGSCFFLGLVSCAVEFRFRPEVGRK